MKNKIGVAVTLFSMVFLAGCPNYSATSYSSYPDNVVKLREFEQKVNLGKFEPNYLVKKERSSQDNQGSSIGAESEPSAEKSKESKRSNEKKTSIMCRMAGPVNPPQGQPFSEYIRGAFVSELKLAKKFDKNSPITLKAKVDKVDFSSVSGKWKFDLTIISSNGQSLNVSEVYDYHTALGAVQACNNASKAFQPAVQNLISNILTHEQFPTLLET